MKLGLIWSKTRSPGQIIEKPCVHFRGFINAKIHETLPECLSQLNLGQDQNWVMSGQKLGHMVRS